MENVEKHLDLLGLKVVDRVTGLKGVVTSVSFDLYGCIQAIVDPGIDKEGKNIDNRWFDIARLKTIGSKPVMETPNFDFGIAAEGKKGPAEKPVQ